MQKSTFLHLFMRFIHLLTTFYLYFCIVNEAFFIHDKDE